MNKIRVLMIDDNIELISMIKEYFNNHAKIELVMEANDGERGLELVTKCQNNYDVVIATIPIGFDDGIGISHINRYVVINNKKYPVIGEISMCMMSILIDDSVKLGDEVTVLGDGITLGMISRLNNTSIHNTLVNIGKTLPRVYIKNNKVVDIVEHRNEVIK